MAKAPLGRARRPTVYDVAERAGVSIAAVSFAFSRPTQLSVATRDRVLAAAREIGYVPSASARGLARGRTGMLGLHAFDMLLERAQASTDERRARAGLQTPDLRAGGVLGWDQTDDETLADPRAFPLYVDEVQRGFELECWLLGRPVLLSSGSPDDVAVAETAGRVDGLAILPGPQMEPALEQLAPSVPVVLLSSPPHAGRHRVGVDNAGGMAALVEHLIAVHGAREFGFVGGLVSPDYVDRFAGYRETLAQRGIEVPAEPFDATAIGAGSELTALRAAVAEHRVPAALVCASDQLAFAVLDVLAGAGLRVPEDVIVTGFDGILASRLSSPSLTTVRQPMEAMGRAAARILAEAADDPADAAPLAVTFATKLVVRRSCGCG